MRITRMRVMMMMMLGVIQGMKMVVGMVMFIWAMMGKMKKMLVKMIIKKEERVDLRKMEY